MGGTYACLCGRFGSSFGFVSLALSVGKLFGGSPRSSSSLGSLSDTELSDSLSAWAWARDRWAFRSAPSGKVDRSEYKKVL